jgi:hypothetical protein
MGVDINNMFQNPTRSRVRSEGISSTSRKKALMGARLVV